MSGISIDTRRRPIGVVSHGPWRTAQLVAHLTAREFRVRYRSAFLGWLWALAPSAARLVVLGVLFSSLLPSGRADYIAELAIGLLSWNWFSAGVASATRSAVDRRDLLSQPALPREVVPVVSVLTDALDYAAALPLLLAVVLMDTGHLPLTSLLLPVLLVLEGCLVLGVGMAASVADVRLRDTRLAVDLLLSIGFYATPVFYSTSSLTPTLQALVQWNPIGMLIEAQRDILVTGTMPSMSRLLAVAVFSLLVLCGGWTLHRRCSPTFLDYL